MSVTSDQLRQRAERAVLDAGHCSPVGSRHDCRTCGGRFAWDQLRWAEEVFPAGRQIVCRHDGECVRKPRTVAK